MKKIYLQKISLFEFISHIWIAKTDRATAWCNNGTDQQGAVMSYKLLVKEQKKKNTSPFPEVMRAARRLSNRLFVVCRHLFTS